MSNESPPLSTLVARTGDREGCHSEKRSDEESQDGRNHTKFLASIAFRLGMTPPHLSEDEAPVPRPQHSALSTQHSALIAQIHASPTMVVLVVTGGGTQAVADLLAVPGASKTVLEALVPYSDSSLREFLGAAPTQAVSVETAAAMAQAAYRRAERLRDKATTPVIGLACTATLATDRPKKGDHRTHVGLCTENSTRVYSLTLTKGARDRAGEERVVSNLLLKVLGEACGVSCTLEIGLLPHEHVNRFVAGGSTA